MILFAKHGSKVSVPHLQSIKVVSLHANPLVTYNGAYNGFGLTCVCIRECNSTRIGWLFPKGLIQNCKGVVFWTLYKALETRKKALQLYMHLYISLQAEPQERKIGNQEGLLLAYIGM